RHPGLLLAALGAIVGPGTRGQSAEPTAPGQWAVIVAVSRYDDETVEPLPYADDDARLFRQTLVDRGGVPEGHVLTMTEESPDDRRPRRENLRRRVPEFLK